MKKIFIIVAGSCLMAACTPSAKVSVLPTAGITDFNNYLAVGSSYTAGFADNSLYVTAQTYSFPALLNTQFQLVQNNGSRGYFIQPLTTGNDGYPASKYVLAMTYPVCDSADSTLGPVTVTNYVVNPADVTYTATTNNGQINNIGVPGIRVVDYPVQGYGTQAVNPYAYRFYHNTAGTPFDELLYRVNIQHPNFFTLWMGMDDVLGYALNGGQGNGNGSAIPLIGNFYNTIDISPIAVFEKNYDSIVNACISTGAQGALISIPDVDSLPFFTTIPANGLILPRQTLVDSMNKLIWASANFNKAFTLGANYFVIQDHNGNVRQAVPGERILLSATQQNIICNGWGSVTPIPAKYVLTTDELQYIRTATQTFNAYIQLEANNHNLAFVDMNSFLAQLYGGYTYNGIQYSMQYITGEAFSLDGINLTPRGNALATNQVVQAINAKYHSTLPMMDVNSYLGISFP